MFPGFNPGTTAPSAIATFDTFSSGVAASADRAATTPCGMISHATRGRIPEALGSRFIEL
jgi:hypothetical protein